jgi:cellulose synthase/poly-beta-1,6-N-acetylglucosamine synthase-like glycosyltransferase
MSRKLLISFLLAFSSTSLFAQGGPVAMADEMRSNGKIYVVVAVVLTILFGIVLYLVRLDRKINRLEKHNS